MVQNRVAEITGDLPAGTELQIERMTPADLPGVHPEPHRHAADGRPLRLRELRRQARDRARARRRASSRCRRATRARSRSSSIPAGWRPRDLTVVDVSDALKAQNTSLPVGRFQESGLQHLALASGLWKNVDQIAQAPVKSTNGATIRVADVGTVTRGAPDRTLLITGNGRDAVVDEHRAADRRQHPRPEGRRRRRARRPREGRCRPASRSAGSTISPSSSRNRSPASATPSSSAASSPSSCCWCSCATGG